MTSFFIYLVKVTVCSALFAGCYWLTLRNTRLFHFCRLYILLSVALSITIPALKINIPTNAGIPAITEYVTHFTVTQDIVANYEVQPSISSFSWTLLGFIAYMSVVFSLLAKNLISFACIFRLKRCSERIYTPQTVLHCIDDASAPFTFFQTVFWKKGIPPDSDEGRCILRHELAHVRMRHSRDKTIMQIVCCIFWINPFFLLFRRELELVHEYAADSETNAEELSSLILCTLYPKNYHDFRSRFFQSPIKKRIFMLTNSKKASMTMLRKMSILPVIIVATYLFACQSSEPKKSEPVIDDVIVNDNVTVNDDVAVKNTGDDSHYSYEEVDVKPTLNGETVLDGMSKYIYANIHYPVEAVNQNIQGRVVSEFIIDTDGSVSNVRIIYEADVLLNEEVLRVLAGMPKFSPGKHQGEYVKVRYQFPVSFTLR